MPGGIHITVHGVPVPKGRPRARKQALADGSEFIQIYADPTSKRYEGKVRVDAQFAMLEAGAPMFDEPLSVTVEAVLPIPKSWSKKKRDAALTGTLPPAKTPDVDNLCKAALDGH